MIDHEEGLHESDVKVENRMFIFFQNTDCSLFIP